MIHSFYSIFQRDEYREYRYRISRIANIRMCENIGCNALSVRVIYFRAPNNSLGDNICLAVNLKKNPRVGRWERSKEFNFKCIA